MGLATGTREALSHLKPGQGSVRLMHTNSRIRDVYCLLGAGVHLSEISRFADASADVSPDSEAVDSEADTIPAPPPSSVRRSQNRIDTKISPARGT